MTISEAVAIYGTKEKIVSYGDNLRKISVQLYQRIDDKTKLILTTLNPRYDWDDLKPGDIIRYLHASTIPKINEVL